MRPNVVFLGFKNDWLSKPQATIDYFNILHDALDLKYGVGILRLQSGLDFSDFFGSGRETTCVRRPSDRSFFFRPNRRSRRRIRWWWRWRRRGDGSRQNWRCDLFESVAGTKIVDGASSNQCVSAEKYYFEPRCTALDERVPSETFVIRYCRCLVVVRRRWFNFVITLFIETSKTLAQLSISYFLLCLRRKVRCRKATFSHGITLD